MYRAPSILGLGATHCPCDWRARTDTLRTVIGASLRRPIMVLRVLTRFCAPITATPSCAIPDDRPGHHAILDSGFQPRTQPEELIRWCGHVPGSARNPRRFSKSLSHCRSNTTYTTRNELTKSLLSVECNSPTKDRRALNHCPYQNSATSACQVRSGNFFLSATFSFPFHCTAIADGKG